MVRTIFMVVLLASQLCPGIICQGQQKKVKLALLLADEHHQPVAGAVVSLAGSAAGAALTGTSDANGTFTTFLQSGQVLHFTVAAPGYHNTADSMLLTGDSVVHVHLHPAGALLREYTVTAKRAASDLYTLGSTELSGRELLQSRGQSLGEALKKLPGLAATQTGPNVYRPVLHGLSGNRLLIVNNDVRLQAQQWGPDHAPETDPFSAASLTVLKGAASVRYGADALAGVILVRPPAFREHPGLSGDGYLGAATNGRAGQASLRLSGAAAGKLSGLAWQATGTLRRAGNYRAPEYFIDNTGLSEADGLLAASWKKRRYELNASWSVYSSKNGIFTGAESGSDSELVRKFRAGKPAVPSAFAYAIGRPYQYVRHHTVKAGGQYQFRNSGTVAAHVALQHNLREEYDLNPFIVSPNPADQDAPQLRLQLETVSGEMVYTPAAKKGWSGNYGANGYTSGNRYAGSRTLIPDYRDYNAGVFAIERFAKGRWTAEAGMRYDYRLLDVYRRNLKTLAVYTSQFTYQNFTGSAGASYRPTGWLSVTANSGLAWRAPNVYELFVNGRHFSAARYEMGDTAMRSERSWNNGFALSVTRRRLRVTLEAYCNLMDHYIYAQPLLTIRRLPGGALPAFAFVQNNARITGIDFTGSVDVTQNVTLNTKATVVRGRNLDKDDWLVSMPADRIENSVTMQPFASQAMRHFYISAGHSLVAEQVRTPASSDFVLPPEAYQLFSAAAGIHADFMGIYADFTLVAENVLNTRYREYLDNFRYFTDQTGRNLSLKIKCSF